MSFQFSVFSFQSLAVRPYFRRLKSQIATLFFYPVHPVHPCFKFLSCVLTCALFAPTLALAQQSPQQTRPRRAPETKAPASSEPGARIIEVARLSGEPTVRIGLSTDARSVNVSTSGQLLSTTSLNETPAPLGVARVRIEPRALTPLPPPEASFKIEIAGAATRVDADRAAGEIRNQTGENSEVSYNATTKTWRVVVGENLSRDDAEDLRTRIEEIGFASATVVGAQPAAREVAANTKTPATSATTRPANKTSVRPTALTGAPTRELAVYATGASTLFSSRAPVTFASADERTSPVRFNEKSYRGRLEVFPNARGTLTVVNVLGIEDYVRGVVPNELSPGGYPAIEALKAQAVAARTYAIKNLNQFASQGFDLLPTTRSQVYGGLGTEHPLSTRAVEETRGIVATYQGEAINALYTSTCGGRTEDVFNEATPYLRGRECALEGKAHFAAFIVKTTREPAEIRDEANIAPARDAAVLSVHGFQLASSRLTDAWLASPSSVAEVRAWLSTVARLARQPLPVLTDDATRTPGFSTALAAAFYGERRADTLMDDADVEYLLSFRDAGDIPASNRADVAMLLRDGALSLYPDATLRPREAMPRGRMIRAIARLLEARNALQLQKATTRPTTSGALILRSNKNRDQSIAVSSDAYLFRAFGDNVSHQMRSLSLVGGEPVTFHLSASGQVDYLEARPAPNGAAAERMSPFTNWTSELSLSNTQSRLSRWARGIGALTDLHIASRGSSRRVTDLELVGANGTAHVRGGRIRSALGLREQLFVIDRRYDAAGRVTGFTFTGRGWGHGVGLCQVGAYGLAKQGLSYDKILQAYYTGIELTKMY
jgi:stage II sporulation protein D